MNKRGFTLIELTVTVSLTVIVLTLSSVAYRAMTRRSQLIMEANQIAVDIRQAESYAASGKEFRNTPGQNIWGFSVDMANPNQYIIFNDANLNSKYDFGEAYRTIQLPAEVSIKRFGYLESNITNPDVLDEKDASRIDIIFTPPDPKVAIYQSEIVGEGNSKDYFYLIIQDRANTTKRIEVNFFGLIDVTR